MSTNANKSIDLKQNGLILSIILVITFISNYFTPLTEVAFPEAIPGFLIIYGICMVGLIIAKFAPFYLPSVAWISLVSILLTIPWTPGSAEINNAMSKVNFLAMLPPVLAYAGIAITQQEVVTFKKSGWKIALVAMLVFTGTYLGSAIIAEIVLKIS